MEIKTDKPAGRRTVLQVLLIVFGLAMMFETVSVLSLTLTINLGTVMPFIIGLPLFAVGIFMRPIEKLCSEKRWAKLLIRAMIVVYAAFFLLVSVTTALILSHAAEKPDKKPAVIIVLGAGIRGASPSATLAYRLQKALEYYQRDNELVIVVSGGQGADEQYSEAEVMANWLVSHGVDEKHILLEDRSASTEENFIFSRELLESKGLAECETAFVTSRFHVFRAGRIAKKLGMDVYGIPARSYKLLIMNDLLRECAAIVQYFCSGKL